jgi:hypothetical protein
MQTAIHETPRAASGIPQRPGTAVSPIRKRRRNAGHSSTRWQREATPLRSSTTLKSISVAPLDHNSRRVREDHGNTFACRIKVRIGSIPVAAPLPEIASHVVQTVAIWREGADGGSTNKAIFSTVFDRKYSLPGIRHVFSVRSKLVAPDKPLTLKAAASCVFPFRLAREPFAGPLRIGDGVVPGDLYDRMILPSFDRACRTFGMPPVRATARCLRECGPCRGSR